MNFWKTKYFWWSVGGVFLWVLFSNFIIHQQILKTSYNEMPGLLRSPEDMQAHWLWMFVGQFLLSFWICFVFPFGYKKEGMWEGVRYGFWVGLFSVAHNLIGYAAMPIPFTLTLAWCMLAIAQSMAAGWIVWKIWQMNPRATAMLKS